MKIAIILEIDKMVNTGMIAISNIEMIRNRRGPR
jgi:hypothetical protein